MTKEEFKAVDALAKALGYIHSDEGDRVNYFKKNKSFGVYKSSTEKIHDIVSGIIDYDLDTTK